MRSHALDRRVALFENLRCGREQKPRARQRRGNGHFCYAAILPDSIPLDAVINPDAIGAQRLDLANLRAKEFRDCGLHRPFPLPREKVELCTNDRQATELFQAQRYPVAPFSKLKDATYPLVSRAPLAFVGISRPPICNSRGRNLRSAA